MASSPDRALRLKGSGRSFFSAAVLVAVLLVPAAASEGLPLTFEDINDEFGLGVVVDNQYAAEGVLFTNALALTAGLSLDEFDFPPHSGAVVVSDAGGAMEIALTQTFNAVSGWFTYSTQITLTAFDSVGNSIGQVVSSVDPNFGKSEFLQLVAAGPIERLVIEGDPLGGSFTMDDFNAQSTATPVPEPGSTGALLMLGAGLLTAARRLGSRRAS